LAGEGLADRIGVDRSNGAVEFVAGSHRWGVRYRPTPFRKGHEIKFTDSDLEQIPAIDADRSEYDIRWWPMAPGDCLVFHAMIVHGAPGNGTAGARRRGLSLRYTGDDARYDRRPGTFQFPHKPDLAAGASMTCDLFPRVWPPTA
jgi:ectoine hydroxylase-related dioxygenase (phytanoyl-CoA dioxygenase family)